MSKIKTKPNTGSSRQAPPPPPPKKNKLKNKTKMSKTKLKILTPTGVTIKDLEIALGEYTSDFRILVEHDEYRVLYTKEVTTENPNKNE